jgi:hypothetical protein
MKKQKQVLIVTGSPRSGKTTSASLGAYLGKKLEEKGMNVEQIRLKTALRSDEETEKLFASLDNADVVVLSCPLYVDCLPYLATQALELIAEHQRTQVNDGDKKRLLALVNGGFPEAHQSHVALEVCRCFAREAHFEWIGGLALGGGSVIAGRPIEHLGWMGRNIRKSLDGAAEAIVWGRLLPEKAVKLMAKPLLPLPSWAIVFIVDWIMRKEAKKRGILKSVNAMPYKLSD